MTDYTDRIAWLRTSNNIYDHEAADALEAQARRIKELESKVTWETASNIATAKLNSNLLARIAELEAAGNLVVEWWLTEGMKVMNGAPYTMFKLRAALENTK